MYDYWKFPILLILKILIICQTLILEHIIEMEKLINSKNKDHDKYKLYYFPAHGLGEYLRIALVLAQVEWEDIKISKTEEWMKFKPKTPNGYLPVL